MTGVQTCALPDLIWNVVEKELPKLKAAFEALEIKYPLPKKETDPGFDPFKDS